MLATSFREHLVGDYHPEPRDCGVGWPAPSLASCYSSPLLGTHLIRSGRTEGEEKERKFASSQTVWKTKM